MRENTVSHTFCHLENSFSRRQKQPSKRRYPALPSPMCGVKIITTVLILLTTVLIFITTVLIPYRDRPNLHYDRPRRDEVPAHPHSRPSGWRRSAGKTGKRYGMMTTKQTFTSSPALLSALFPEWFQTSDSREVQLFQFVRNNEHQPNKSQ